MTARSMHTPPARPSPGAGADSVIDRAVALMVAVSGVRRQPRDEAILIRRLAAADALIERRQSSGDVDSSTALRWSREAHLVHRLLRSRRGHTAPANGSLRDALTQAAVDLCDEFGFDRSMTFEVGFGVLDPVATRFVERDEWASRVHRCAVEQPPALDLAVFESAVVAGQRTLLVEDAQGHPGSWKPVVVPLMTTSYAVAPVIVGGRTVGTIHADRWFTGVDVTVGDRDLIALVGAEVSRRVQADLTARAAAAPVLTERQDEILDLIASGHTNAAIACELFISPETVKSHVKRIFTALGVSTRAEAVRRHFGA